MIDNNYTLQDFMNLIDYEYERMKDFYKIINFWNSHKFCCNNNVIRTENLVIRICL